MTIKTDYVLDAKGLACPMPIVKTKKALKDLASGEVVEILATDAGSTADLKAWAGSTGNHYLGTVQEGEVWKHYIRKKGGEDREEMSYPKTVKNEELGKRLDDMITIIDVREHAEYAFNHIPGAISIPLGSLENRLEELQKEDEIYVVCRTGNRSDMAAQLLSKHGFANVTNVLPGMSDWQGKTESL
ncbi:sulfurtransferase TusA family protein [Bacillus piscicola]|uniref:sulfurtransferase TusA family protein n=1 Tax=Bacillus piscicola TaxID=1632684 RepID=UPI001F09226C|nr:sulfurtransferase TusA family protein [Bacillus piscicola]